MICYVLAMGKQHLGPHVVVGYGIKIFWPGLFYYVTRSPGHCQNLGQSEKFPMSFSFYSVRSQGAHNLAE